MGIGLIMGTAYYLLIRNNGLLAENGSSFWAAIVIILTFVGGAALLMWLGEQITEHGIGNGISIILFASIVSRFPNDIVTSVRNIMSGELSWWLALLVLLMLLAIIVLIVYVNDAERRLPVQYAKRVVGRKVMGGQSTFLPILFCSLIERLDTSLHLL